MPTYKNFLKVAELGLGGNEEELLSFLRKVAKEEINKNHHSSYKGLTNLIDLHAQDTNRITPSSYQAANNEAHYLPANIWVSPNIERKLQGFVGFYKTKGDINGNSLNHLNKILLYGPPGTGKTTLGFYIAKLLNKDLKYVKISDVVSSKFGETLKNISDIFTNTPEEIVFIDEFDAFAKSRTDNNDVGELKRIVNSMIQTLDFQANNKIVLVSTNLVDSIDAAVLRRFPFKILVDYLTKEEKISFFNFLLLNNKNTDIEASAKDAVFILDLLNLKTVDEIKTFFEKALISNQIRNGKTLSIEDFIEVAIFDGQLHRGKVKQLKRDEPKKIAKLGRYLETKGYSKKKISEILGIHRNSYSNYVG